MRAALEVDARRRAVVVGRGGRSCFALRSLCVSFGVVGIRKTFIIRNSYTPRLDTRLTLLLLLCFFRLAFFRCRGARAGRIPKALYRITIRPSAVPDLPSPWTMCMQCPSARPRAPVEPSRRALPGQPSACEGIAQTTKGKNRRQEGEAERAEGRHARRTHRRREGDLLLRDTE